MMLCLFVLGLTPSAMQAQTKQTMTISIWDGTDNTDSDRANAILYGFLPNEGNGKAVIICPGGGYQGLCMDYEGTDFATWFNEHGIAAFVLRYRLPATRHAVPLADAAGYYLDSADKKRAAARIDRLFDKYAAALAAGELGSNRRIVILKNGSLSRSMPVPDGLRLSGKTGGVVVDLGGAKVGEPACPACLRVHPVITRDRVSGLHVLVVRPNVVGGGHVDLNGDVATLALDAAEAPVCRVVFGVDAELDVVALVPRLDARNVYECPVHMTVIEFVHAHTSFLV